MWCQLPPPQTTVRRAAGVLEAGAPGRGAAVSIQILQAKRPKVNAAPSSPRQHCGEWEGGCGPKALCGVSGGPRPWPSAPWFWPDSLPSGGPHVPPRGLEGRAESGPRPRAGSQNPAQARWEERALLQADVFCSRAETGGTRSRVCRWVGVEREPGGLGAGAAQMVSVERGVGGRRFGESAGQTCRGGTGAFPALPAASHPRPFADGFRGDPCPPSSGRAPSPRGPGRTGSPDSWASLASRSFPPPPPGLLSQPLGLHQDFPTFSVLLLPPLLRTPPLHLR